MLPSLIVAGLTAAVVRRLAPRWGLVDRPGHRKVHTTPTPLGGGLAIWLGVLVPFAFAYVFLVTLVPNPAGGWLVAGRWPLPNVIAMHVGGLASQTPRLWFLLASGTVLVVLGLIDDRRGLDWKLRLAFQTAVAVAMVWFWHGWRLTLYLNQPWLTYTLSVLWIVGLINSFNMLDNMDGLSGGVAAIAAAMLAAVLLTTPNPATHQPQLFVSGFLLVLVGSLAGFLWHNRPPARIFMGDAGSYFIGFCLAIATNMATFTGGDLPWYTMFVPLCILAVPLYDTVTVVWIRLRQGRSPFEADKNHFSHRLVELGMTKGQAVLTIYLTTFICGLGALLLHQVDWLGALAIMMMIFCVLTLISVLETTGRKARQEMGGRLGDGGQVTGDSKNGGQSP
jgi:UDP-GlcNAc:undecaprenyl-phosphate GlcNAc-1-phosphate transferase